ncbi:GNAT family N-acetyltransferase [Maribacter sp. 2304DJ31-5]|uniref:GNAT family N-acetyltransferase n=1 Tax=Maribacter sp. 2304DJ31-5 TaxID=3386273 RepID=UPI0039BC86CB
MLQFEFDDFIIYPVQEKDAWRLCDFVTINSERLKKYFPKTLEANQTPDLAKYFTIKKQREFEHKEEFLFVLKEKENRTIIGLVYVKNIKEDIKQGELAYAISYNHERKGYITKSVSRLCHWAFEVLKLKTLQIIAHNENIPSIKVAENCGFRWTNTLVKKFTPPNSIALDMELYELKNER